MIRLLYASLFALLLSPLASAADDASKAELDALQGSWEVVSLERNGKPADPKTLVGRVLVIDKETFADKQGEKTLGKGTLTVDASGTPKTIDALFTEGFPKGMTSKAIYERDGDALKACAGGTGKDRPADFSTSAGSGRMLVTYRRKK